MEFTYIVIDSIVEEFVMQGVVQTYFQRFGTFFSVIGTGIIFFLVHFDFFPLGYMHGYAEHWPLLIWFLMLAHVRRYTGSLVFVIMLHVVYNWGVDMGHLVPDWNVPFPVYAP